MNPASVARPVDDDSNASKKTFFDEFDIILALRLTSIGILIASTVLHFNGDEYTPILNVLASIILLTLVWHLLIVLRTARLPQVWQLKQQHDATADDGRPTAYQRLGPLNDAWLGVFLFMITVWVKTLPESWRNIQFMYNFRVFFVLNLIVV
ncbi:hypothetical protein PG993_003202 [Apiospora rasikravindrae]|uniref:Uncharacterized protein n=1 Tax=Apiospora rasikravindrae TaxID=990691 RepID=A0ABR1TZA3_9PEZI